jgi:hypothetical protein
MALAFEKNDGEAPFELNAFEPHRKKTACPDIVQDRPDGEDGDPSPAFTDWRTASLLP